MGWTSKTWFNFNHTNWEDDQMDHFIRGEFGYPYEILQIYNVRAIDEYDHNESYVLMRHPDGYLFVMTVLVDVKGSEIYWKEMDETQGPAYHNCPMEFLFGLPETDNTWAKLWRNECAKKNIKMNPNTKVKWDYDKSVKA